MKLNKNMASQIRIEYKGGKDIDELSKFYKVTKSSICNVINNIFYKDKNYKGLCRGPKKMSIETANEIRRKFNQNQTVYGQSGLAKEYAVSEQTIYNILNNKVYKNSHHVSCTGSALVYVIYNHTASMYMTKPRPCATVEVIKASHSVSDKPE